MEHISQLCRVSNAMHHLAFQLNIVLLLAGYQPEDFVTFVPQPSASPDRHPSASTAEPDRRSQPMPHASNTTLAELQASNVTSASSVEPHNASFQATHPSAATAAVSAAQPGASAAISARGSESGAYPVKAANRQPKVAPAAKNAETLVAANSPWSIKAAAAAQPLFQIKKAVPGAFATLLMLQCIMCPA